MNNLKSSFTNIYIASIRRVILVVVDYESERATLWIFSYFTQIQSFILFYLPSKVFKGVSSNS